MPNAVETELSELIDEMLRAASPLCVEEVWAREWLVGGIQFCAGRIAGPFEEIRRRDANARSDAQRADRVARLSAQLIREIEGALSEGGEPSSWWGYFWLTWGAGIKRLVAPYPRTWLGGSLSDNGRQALAHLDALNNIREMSELFGRIYKSPAGRPRDPSRLFILSAAFELWPSISNKPIGQNRKSFAEFVHFFESAVIGSDALDNERLLKEHVWPLFA